MASLNNHIFILSTKSSSLNTFSDFLIKENYEVILLKTVSELFNQLAIARPFLVLLELDFPEKDGITLTFEIRNNVNYYPFIVLFSDKIDDYVHVTALDAGADDFIKLPFKSIFLKPRFKALSNRFIGNALVTPAELRPNFIVDKDRYVVFINNNKINLPRKEFEILFLLYSNPDKIFTRRDIALQIWNNELVEKSRTIDIHIHHIRKALTNQYLYTRKNIGYYFSAIKHST